LYDLVDPCEIISASNSGIVNSKTLRIFKDESELRGSGKEISMMLSIFLFLDDVVVAIAVVDEVDVVVVGAGVVVAGVGVGVIVAGVDVGIGERDLDLFIFLL
jgi:hypothetical protein